MPGLGLWSDCTIYTAVLPDVKSALNLLPIFCLKTSPTTSGELPEGIKLRSPKL